MYSHFFRKGTGFLSAFPIKSLNALVLGSFPRLVTKHILRSYTGKPQIEWLKGVRVLLNANYIPGPLAALLLRGLGAEVIKVEAPFGDLMRKLPPFLSGKDGKKMSAYFRALNSGFQSIALNFKKPEDVIIFKTLIKKSDILIDGNRAHSLSKKVLGCEPTDINPNITYVPITAYGLTGPMQAAAGHDDNMLAFSGNLSFNTTDKKDLPSIFGSQLAGITTGYAAALMAVSSVFGRRNPANSTQIKTIDASVLHSAFFLNQIYVAGMNVTKRSPVPNKEIFNGGLANYRMYVTKNNKPLFFGPIEKDLFLRFCMCIGEPGLMSLLGNRNEELAQKLDIIFKTKTLEEWQKTLSGIDCCFTKVNTLEEAMQETQVKILRLVSSVQDATYGQLRLTNFPVGFSGLHLDCPELPAPELDEHGKIILSKVVGYTEEQITHFITNKSILEFDNHPYRNIR